MVVLKIKDEVDRQGLNIQHFADKAGLAYGTAYGLYKERVRRIDLATLDSICEALNVEPGALFVRIKDDKAGEL